MRAWLATGLMFFAAAGSAAPSVHPPMTAAECAVWQRELGFSDSVANHDAKAFAAYLHPGAVFIDDGGVARGAPAVIAKWAPLVRGDGVRLRWHPERVVIGGDPDTALSMGPYWFDDPKQTAEPRFRVGRFISTWKRDRHGVWHVLFDGGGGSQPQPATTEQMLALQAKLPKTCAP
ncbi:MAG: nuclear transport factor 2 family protein [Xanthomonadales bacterium]|nr:nuclear transport factor 2 family protein [Xanthomonadales bacterium]